MTFDYCLKIVRPKSRYTILSFLLVSLALLAYCARQQHELDNIREDLQYGSHPPPSATRLRRKLQVFNQLGNYLDPKSTASREQATHINTRVSYVTSFWAKVKGEKADPHRREVEAALLANIHNPHFDQVVVFLDREDNAETCFEFHQAMSDLSRQVFSMTAEESNELLSIKVKCVDVQTGQPTYYQMFKNALSDVVTGDVVVLANADMAFDDSMSLARFLNPEVLVVLGTNGFSNKMTANIKYIYEEVMGNHHGGGYHGSEADRCAVTRSSWDTYIFHKSKLVGRLKEENFKRTNQRGESIFFYMNEIGAENAALWAVQQSYPFSSHNPCERIHSWHFHLTPKKHKARKIPWLRVIDLNSRYKNPERVPEPYAFPLKTIIGAPTDCAPTDNCFLSL
mmetsp:Transcript_8920/g.14615  ORF Transcript_8920/g.14615 Transcript_8920/m.14615 type:complete len:397 (+) Transcript_8920:253-1443(+)